MSEKVMSALTDIITKSIEENGTLPWRRPWFGSSNFVPQNLIGKKPFRGINFMMTALTGWASPYFLTMKQAKDIGLELDYSNGKPLYTPIVKWIWFSKEDQEEMKFGGMKFYQEYNLTQFKEWEKVPTPESKVVVMNDNERIASAEAVIAGYTKRPTMVKGSRACYVPFLDNIQMPDISAFISSEHYYSTLFHEMAHSTGHKDRLNRPGFSEGMDGFGSKQYSFEELIAEISACFLCNRIGIDTKEVFDNSAAYLQSWLKKFKSDVSMLTKASQASQKATDMILGTSWKPSAEENPE